MDKNKISTGRKVLFYLGNVLVVVGIVLFISVFFTFFSDDFDASFNSMPRSVIDIIFIGFGSFLRSLGGLGPAGSGILLDPERARKDLKPHTNMLGEMVSDVVEKINANKEDIQIKVKCQSCGTLNDEDATYCKSCGVKIGYCS